ncbi:hypothetical protein KUCAC02_025259 [Chaenocephalus aceratus]|nr:hypothetical protein KUCAC02_025259 [Chaenocephalus aceratus]
MAAPPDTESLESLIKTTDWSSIHAFCDQLNNDLEGPQLATRLLAHKIQSSSGVGGPCKRCWFWRTV